jgi:hypothetical protein
LSAQAAQSPCVTSYPRAAALISASPLSGHQAQIRTVGLLKRGAVPIQAAGGRGFTISQATLKKSSMTAFLGSWRAEDLAYPSPNVIRLQLDLHQPCEKPVQIRLLFFRPDPVQAG